MRKLDNCIDFRFIEEIVKDLYSKGGRPSVPPVVLFKLIFINIVFGINSMRRTCEECKVNVAYRWFLGLSIYDDIPNYSTWSQDYIRRYKDSEVSNQTFCDKNGFVLISITALGNIYDSVAFFRVHKVLNKKFKEKIKNVCLDAGYVNLAICREILM